MGKKIIVENLSIGYDKKPIIDNLNFSIDSGDYLCIIGENGAGKSTLMKTLLSLIPKIDGEIKIDGDQIGYLPQQNNISKDFPASVKEVVLSGLQGKKGFMPFYSKEDKLIATENMKRMNILDMQNKCFRELSGGQQQRVLLARALCATKEIILLDEPVSGLDPKVTLSMYETIYSLNKSGITIIMISHDIKESLKYASHILHIGDKVFFGTKEDYLKSPVGKFFVEQEDL